MEDFGVIIACCYQDYLFAKGCCASIRHFLGDVPICLIVDGTFDTKTLQEIYKVKVINHSNINNQFLRRRSFGWGLTKMIAFFESPWSSFLFLDADTNIWGNILQFADFQNYDVVIDKPCYGYTPEQVSEFFFDVSAVEQHFPDFPWRQYQNDYFCTGTFFAKKGIFPLKEYEDILDFHQSHPGIFKYGEMGFLNFMLFRAAHEGRIKLTSEDFQVIAPDFSQGELKKRFGFDRSSQPRPLVQGNDAAVIHWAGPKPRLETKQTYSRPMDFARRQFILQEQGLTGVRADMALKIEDWLSLLEVYKNKFLKKLRQRGKSKTRLLAPAPTPKVLLK
jgi:hypothetical protein